LAKAKTHKAGTRSPFPAPARLALLGMIGVPYDENSSHMRGTAEAPRAIREALASESTNTWDEEGSDVTTYVRDLGDVSFTRKVDPFYQIESFIRRALDHGFAPIVLGGDHSITYASVRAVAALHDGLTILHFDAHPDLYDEFKGNRHSHASVFARIMEAKLAKRLVQIGIRTANGHQREQAKKLGVETIEMKKWKGKVPKTEGPIYVSFDMDVLDPAFAPGVSHHEPGGMSLREALTAIQSLPESLVGADIVEVNPRRDRSEVTAMCAAKILKELAAKMFASIQDNKPATS